MELMKMRGFPRLLTLRLFRRARRLHAVADLAQARNARTPAIENNYFVTRDGLALSLAHWDAAISRAIIVALHGMNDYSNAFAIPGPLWA